MARREVVEVRCDRCPRVELRNEYHKPKEVHAFYAQLEGDDDQCREISFGDLCRPCLQAVLQHLDQAGKKLDSMSPDRTKEGAKKEGG